MNYALYCTDCGSNVTEDGICGLCFYGESVRQIEHHPPETDESYDGSASNLIDNLMDEFEAGIDDRLSRLERGETVLIEGLIVPEPKTDAPLLQLPGHSACGCTARQSLLIDPIQQADFIRKEQDRANKAWREGTHPGIR